MSRDWFDDYAIVARVSNQRPGRMTYSVFKEWLRRAFSIEARLSGRYTPELRLQDQADHDNRLLILRKRFEKTFPDKTLEAMRRLEEE